MYRVDRYMMRGESENLLNFANSKIISGCSVNFQMAAVGCTILSVDRVANVWPIAGNGC